MINFEYYKVFYNVAKQNSITLAAEELFISQPAVSQIIKQLESLLGGSLFYRTSKGVRLTPEGEILYKYVSKGYEYMDMAEIKFKELLNLEAGEIRIGASDMTLQFYLLSYLEEFHKLYPKVKVKITNMTTPETLKCLHDGKIDFGVVSEPVDEYNGVKFQPVLEIQDVFVANNSFIELRDRAVDFKELQSYPLICLDDNTSTRRYVDNFLKGNSIIMNPEFELATSDLIIQFALKSLGIGSVVKNFAREQIKNGELFEINMKMPIPPRNICIAVQNNLPISPAGKKLLNLLTI